MGVLAFRVSNTGFRDAAQATHCPQITHCGVLLRVDALDEVPQLDEFPQAQLGLLHALRDMT